MATHHLSAQLEPERGDDELAAWIERLRRFYLANGYELEREQGGGADDEDGPSRLVMRRGAERAGWWSSDMTELLARVDISRASGGGQLSLIYRVDVRGQVLSEQDRAFWERELEAAQAFAAGDREHPEDLRQEEGERARGRSRETMSSAGRGFVIAFLVLFVAALLLQRVGCVEL